MSTRNLILVGVAVLIVSISYLGFDGSPAPRGPVSVAPPAGAPLEYRPDLERLISEFAGRTEVSSDPLDFRYLGRLYLAKARLTADLPTYRQARASFAAARNLYPDDAEATGLEAQAAFFLHDFSGARRLTESWRQLEPDSIDVLALGGDIQLAVGNVGEARAAYEELAQVAPTHPAVQARLAQLAVAEGDPTGALSRAITAHYGAVEAGLSGPALAWYQSFSGQLAFDLGDYPQSELLFAAALDNFRGSAHDQAGLGRARAAQGDLAGAIALLERATSGTAAVDDLGYLGDLYIKAGRVTEAASTFQTIEDQLLEGTLDTTVHGRLAALYFLDHDVHLDLALELAKADLEKRPDAGAWDTYAWALYKNGLIGEAREASQTALAAGAVEAGFHFHAGVIANDLGDTDEAKANLERALQISPQFHPLHASTAASLLETLSW